MTAQAFTKFFPIMMIGLQFGSSASYFIAGDYRHGFYWLGGVIITCAVTF